MERSFEKLSRSGKNETSKVKLGMILESDEIERKQHVVNTHIKASEHRIEEESRL